MSFLSLFFPEHCLCCGKYHETPLCNACLSCFPRKKKRLCPCCQKYTTENGVVCTTCYGNTPLDGVFSATSYQHPTVSRVLSAYKYGFSKSLHHPLAKLLASELLQNNIPLPDAIIPVPLHSRRLRWRGFNQSHLLAKRIARTLLPGTPLPVFNTLLSRTRSTIPQAKTSTRKTRLNNLKNAFAFSGSSSVIVDKRLWIVDDVATTNATLTECARVLKKHGAKEVWGIVVAS